MKRCLLFACLCIGCGQASAEIYKYVDADGHVTYSSTPRKGAQKLNLEPPSAPAVPSRPAERSMNRGTPSPADFPKVNGSTQKSRDDARRKILQNEMATEEKLLQDARRNLQEDQTRNSGKQDERTRALRAELTLHEKNIEALRTELGNIR